MRYRSLRSFYCGGNYTNGTNAGVFYANGNNSRANTGTYAGTDAGAHTIFEIRAYRKYVL